MPRFEDLATFCKVVELKSFSRAAEALGISQPAVSQQVKSLEGDYGVQLLHREGYEVLTTEHGRVVYQFACQILDSYERSRQQVISLSGLLEGRLQVGASSGPGEYLVPLLLGKFKAQYPAISVAMRVADSHDVIEGVFNHQYEIGFVGDMRRDRHLVFEPYIEDNLVLVVNPNHPFSKHQSITYEDLLKLPLILQQQGSGAISVLQEALREQGLSLNLLNVIMEAGLQESTKTAVRAGYGATIISRLGVREELKRGILVHLPVEGLELHRWIYACYYRSAPLSTLAQAFLDYSLQYKDSLFAEA